MRIKGILFILLILSILMMFFILPGCSTVSRFFSGKALITSGPGEIVVEKIIPRERLNTGGPPAKIVKRHHVYVYEAVHSAGTRQFVITDMPVFIKPPERAVRLNLKEAVIGKRIEIRTSLPRKPIKPEAAKGPQSRQVRPDRSIKTVTVSFAINSYALSPHETEKLNQFIKRSDKPGQPRAVDLSAPPKSGSSPNFVVDVAGYTCWFGSKKYNQWLALKRAKAVAFRLKKAGITIQSVSGKGKCCYIDLKNPAPNRRAEVSVSQAASKQTRSKQADFEQGVSRKGGDAENN